MKVEHKFGDWVKIKIDGKLYGQFIHYTPDGKLVIDINGLWREYQNNQIEK